MVCPVNCHSERGFIRVEESAHLRSAAQKMVRRSFDSLRSLRMTVFSLCVFALARSGIQVYTERADMESAPTGFIVDFAIDKIILLPKKIYVIIRAIELLYQ